MHSKKSQNNNLNSYEQKLSSLKKINLTDKFPCFLCYDDPRERHNCE